MVYDDIIIGSGLTALAVAYGLPLTRRVIVLTGGKESSVDYYDSQSNVPCQNIGRGGLGEFWHGVIPMQRPTLFPSISERDMVDFFQIFYSDKLISRRIFSPWLFVPFQPIRPRPHWKRLSEASSGRLTLVNDKAMRIFQKENSWVVQTSSGRLKTNRLWLAAGPLGTPALLESSGVLEDGVRQTASDHVILYLGQIDRQKFPKVAAPVVKRTSSGYWLEVSPDIDALITKKPARFNYKKLDHGIEQRSAFGLPATGVLKKIVTAGSLGFLMESLFNKLGLFPDSRMLSIYAQLRVADSYERLRNGRGVRANKKSIASTIQQFRDSVDVDHMIASERPELYIKGIHLHGTLDSHLVNSRGFSDPESNLCVVDASIVDDIGSEHHSFRLMVDAYRRAKQS